MNYLHKRDLNREEIWSVLYLKLTCQSGNGQTQTDYGTELFCSGNLDLCALDAYDANDL